MKKLVEGIEVSYHERIYTISWVENVPPGSGWRAILAPVNNQEYRTVWLPPEGDKIIASSRELLDYLGEQGVTARE